MRKRVVTCANKNCASPWWEEEVRRGRKAKLCPTCLALEDRPLIEAMPKAWPIDFMNQIIHGDCLLVMKRIPDESVDMILSDLPYGVTARNEWDIKISCKLIWEQFRRIIKSKGVVALTATQPFASELIESNREMFRYDLIWEKNKPTGFLNANKMPLRSHESVLIYYKELPIYNPQKTFGHKPVNSFTKKKTDGKNYGETQMGIVGHNQTDRFPTSVISIPVVNNDSSDKIHPTQKPVELFKYLISTYTNEGQVVLDPCLGSGTAAVACLYSKRNYIGIEIDGSFCQKARQRVLKTELPMF